MFWTSGIFVFLLLACGIAYYNEDDQLRRTRVYRYAVIPSLIYACIGHLFFAHRTSVAMGWGDCAGVNTLQRELGLSQLAMAIVACFFIDDPRPLVMVWSLGLLMIGVNHVVEKRGVSLLAASDVMYGSVLLSVFA